MQKQVWDDALAVGVPTIDAQHKRLFIALEKFKADLETQIPPDVVVDKILELQEYCLDHFSAEKALLAPYAKDIPLYHEHMAQHVGFAQVTDIYVKRAEEQGTAIGQDLYNFLHNWLEGHIVQMDIPCFATLAKLKK